MVATESQHAPPDEVGTRHGPEGADPSKGHVMSPWIQLSQGEPSNLPSERDLLEESGNALTCGLRWWQDPKL
jgi:hypothetical protein